MNAACRPAGEVGAISRNVEALLTEAVRLTVGMSMLRSMLISTHATSDAIILQAMTNLLVRDLPDDVHRALQQRAKSHGQSLQQYLSSELTRIATRPSLVEVLDRIDRRSGGEVGLARATKDLAKEREQR